MKKIQKPLIASLIMSLLPIVAWTGPVNINTADAKTLAKELDGIGESRAQAIVEYREQHGEFNIADDLKNVKGIGAQVLEQNRGNIKVGHSEDED